MIKEWIQIVESGEMSMEIAEAIVKAEGCKVSACSFDEEDRMVVFSIEAVPNLWGAPKVKIDWDKDSGFFTVHRAKGSPIHGRA